MTTKPKSERFFYQFWVKESGLSSMLLLLFGMHFVIIPLFGSRSSFMVMLNIFWMLLIFAGIFTLSRSKEQAIRYAIIPFLFVICRWIETFYSGGLLRLADFTFTILTVLMLIVLILIKVFEPGPVTAHRIIGSIVIYMLLANFWEIIYLFIFNQIDGSFQFTPSQFEMTSDQSNFMYFSYITLTSTGFGEIVPLHPIARAWVQIEALVGILYPVVLIGRLVSDVNYKQPELP